MENGKKLKRTDILVLIEQLDYPEKFRSEAHHLPDSIKTKAFFTPVGNYGVCLTKTETTKSKSVTFTLNEAVELSGVSIKMEAEELGLKN